MTEIRNEILSYFIKRFKESDITHPRLDGVDFKTISAEDNLALTSPFNLDGIEEVVSKCDGNKCPGPDGFNFSFFKRLYNLMRLDMDIMFNEFHRFAFVPHRFSSYFVTLVPKVKNPTSLGDFRPVFLVDSLYKLVAKFLA